MSSYFTPPASVVNLATSKPADVNNLNTATDNAFDLVEAAINAHLADTTTHGTTGDVVGISDSQTLTNKTIDANNNTISNLVTGDVVGTTDAQTLTNKTINSSLSVQYPIQGTSSHISGYGLYGNASSATGTTYGVFGAAASADGYGVYSSGRAHATLGTGGGIIETGTNASIMNIKVIDIGDWNMDAVSQVNIAHGLTLSKIRHVSVIVRDDLDSSYNPAGSWITSTSNLDLGINNVSSTQVWILRTTGGYFDNTGFDSTSYNRGWITIWYTD